MKLLDITIKPQDYVCVIYEEKSWIGWVEECSDEYGDYIINFMQHHSPVKFLYWLDPTDKCWIDESDILCVIDVPMIVASGQRIQYKLTASDNVKISTVCTVGNGLEGFEWQGIFMQADDFW